MKAKPDVSTKTKDNKTDSKWKLNYRGNFEKHVKEKIKLSNKKGKENSRVLKRDITKGIFNSPYV